MYIHDLPTTGAISFQDFLHTTSHVAELARATEHRAALRAILKEQRHEAAGQAGKDYMRVVKAVDEYLPYLFGIFNCVQTDDLILRHEPEFSWRSTLSSSFLRAPSRISLPGLYYELISVLLLSGLAHSNLASSIVHSLGAYERDRSLDSSTRKASDERLKFAADLLCKASGIFVYLSESLIPQWENSSGRSEVRPPDVTREVTLALSKLALADAETLAIRKLLSPFLASSTDTMTPGPPLPSAHPSASLLAKLSLNVAALYEGAASLARTAGKKPGVRGADALAGDAEASRRLEVALGKKPSSSLRDGEDGIGSSKRTGLFSKLKQGGTSSGKAEAPDDDLQITPKLLRYLSSSALLARARAYKWLAIDAGEAGKRYGEAIVLLKMSAEGLEEVEKNGGVGFGLGMSGLRERGGKESRENVRAKSEEEVEIVKHWLKSYTNLNDLVAFQPLPAFTTLQQRIPAGRAALSLKPYTPPVPPFGPGSPGYLSEGMKRLGVLDSHADANEGSGREEAVGGVLGASKKKGDYLGAGAYY